VTRVADGALEIAAEGSHRKFMQAVEHVTFSGAYAREKGQRVLYVTERAVFELRPMGSPSPRSRRASTSSAGARSDGLPPADRG